LIAHVRRLRSYVAKFLYRDDKSTPLPLFVRSPHTKSSHSIKSATQAATAAAGGTSLLIVTFMILGWTATVPVSPAKNGSSPGLAVAQPNGVFSFFPGRSRSLLESNRQNVNPIGPVTKPDILSHDLGNPMDSVPSAVLDPPLLSDRMNSVKLEIIQKLLFVNESI
uniref:Transmembrane protein n=1 Tax=Echinostoma caproni TaxID=27848 RepID=A0A183AZC3_9TREM